MQVRKMRTKNKVSQLDLAYGAEISRFRLFMIEKGYLVPTSQEIERIKKYLSEHSLRNNIKAKREKA